MVLIQPIPAIKAHQGPCRAPAAHGRRRRESSSAPAGVACAVPHRPGHEANSAAAAFDGVGRFFRAGVRVPSASAWLLHEVRFLILPRRRPSDPSLPYPFFSSQGCRRRSRICCCPCYSPPPLPISAAVSYMPGTPFYCFFPFLVRLFCTFLNFKYRLASSVVPYRALPHFGLLALIIYFLLVLFW